MSIYGEPRVWLEEIPLGEPQAFTHDYLGLRYSGEVIRANSWEPVWGEPLTGELYFRIVLLLRRQGAPTPAAPTSAMIASPSAPRARGYR